MEKQSPWQKYLAEFLGTAILLLLGLSLVIFMFGEGSPASEIIPNYKLKQCMTGFLFGCVGASIALSPLGRSSGAHINPAVTLAFRLFDKIDLKTSFGYIIAQLAGAIVVCFPLLIWGTMGGMVDLLGRPDHRNSYCIHRLQYSGEENHRSKVVSFRFGEGQVASKESFNLNKQISVFNFYNIRLSL
jgi:hypothetical protein